MFQHIKYFMVCKEKKTILKLILKSLNYEISSSHSCTVERESRGFDIVCWPPNIIIIIIGIICTLRSQSKKN